MSSASGYMGATCVSGIWSYVFYGAPAVESPPFKCQLPCVHFLRASFLPQTDLAVRVLTDSLRGLERLPGALVVHFDQKKRYLVTLAFVSPKRNMGLKHQYLV